MRMITFAIMSALAAGIAAPAAAAAKPESWKPTYNACEALAMNRGITITERRASEQGPSPYRQFMVSCLAGKVEGKPIVTARVAPAAQIPTRWDSCEELSTKRGIDVNERRSTDTGPSSWRQFMSACIAGKVH